MRYTRIQPLWPGEGNINSGPRFRWLGTLPLFPSADSPLVDAGDPALEDGLSDWAPGWPMDWENGPRSDIGAYGGPCNATWLGWTCDVDSGAP